MAALLGTSPDRDGTSLAFAFGIVRLVALGIGFGAALVVTGANDPTPLTKLEQRTVGIAPVQAAAPETKTPETQPAAASSTAGSQTVAASPPPQPAQQSQQAPSSQPAEAQPNQAAAATAQASTISARDFVHKASIANQFEIESSQLALDKAQSSEVKSFAQRMVDDHTKDCFCFQK